MLFFKHFLFLCKKISLSLQNMKHLFTVTLILIGLNLQAQDPANYYLAAEGKTDAALKTQLYSIISSGYVTKTYDYLYTIYTTSDKTPSGKVWDMYSTCDWTFGYKECGNYSLVCDCFNREHSIPQSWFSSKSPMVSDAFHVYPTDGKVNGQRSNFPYGESANGNTLSAKALGKLGSSTFPGYSGTVFEPVDEYKGDFARTYFYFATRYENIMTSIGGESFSGNKYPALTDWSVNLFLKWHRQDPVSQKEIDRNNAVYNHQENRNPFIDHPELAEYIWGNKKGIAWSQNIPSGPQLLIPANNSIVEFGNIPYQENYSILLDIKAANLTGNLSLTVTGTDQSYFSLSTSTITKAEAEAGYKLAVTCNPQSLGVVSADLNISGGGITASAVHLKATSSDTFMALLPSGITQSGFTANWTASANATGYLLNVYSYKVTGTQSRTILEEHFDNGLPKTWSANDTGYFETETSSNIRMASSSKNCILTTPAIDLSGNTVLTVRARRYVNDTDATIRVDVNSDSLTTFTTGIDYADFTAPIPETGTGSTLKFTVLKGKRVYLDYVKVATEGSVETPVSVTGYPKQVGNVLNYQVTGLYNDSTYYYTVTPQGNGALISSEIQAVTTSSTGTNSISDLSELVVYFADNTLYISNLKNESRIVVYSVLGNKILDYEAHSDQVSLPFEYKGIYILQVVNNNKVTGSRKMILH